MRKLIIMLVVCLVALSFTSPSFAIDKKDSCSLKEGSFAAMVTPQGIATVKSNRVNQGTVIDQAPEEAVADMRVMITEVEWTTAYLVTTPSNLYLIVRGEDLYDCSPTAIDEI